MEKDARIVRLQARLATINSERAEIEAEISALAKQERMGPAETGKGEVRGTLGPALTASEKIALFRGRADVFPVRGENPKTGKSGYSPACDNEWRHGHCGKPRIKYSVCPNQAFTAISDELIKRHLRFSATSDNPFVIDVYAMLPDNICWFLAADFDRDDWRRPLWLTRKPA